MRVRLPTAVVLILLVPWSGASPVRSAAPDQAYDAGRKAFSTGDYATALGGFRKAAEQGETCAIKTLARLERDHPEIVRRLREDEERRLAGEPRIAGEAGPPGEPSPAKPTPKPMPT